MFAGRIILCLALSITLISNCESRTNSKKNRNKENRQVGSKFVYPEVRRDEFIEDDYFGTKIADPYRWLEEAKGAELKLFVDSQNNVTNNYLLDSKEVRDELQKRFLEIQNAPNYELPIKRGNRYFLFVTEKGVREYFIQDTRDSAPRILLNPETFPAPPAVNSISPDGELVAYQVIAAGRGGNQERRGGPKYNLYIRNITTNEDYAEVLTVGGFPTLTWTRDSRGFFYVRQSTKVPKDGEDPGPPNDKLFFHKIGTSQKVDHLVANFQDFPFLYSSNLEITFDGSYLLTTPVGIPVENDDISFFVANLEKDDSGFIDPDLTFQPVLTGANYSRLEYVSNDGTILYFIINSDSSYNFKLVGIDLKAPRKSNWTIVIPEDPVYHLETADAVDNDKVIVRYTDPKQPGIGLVKVELRYIGNGSLIRSFPVEAGEDLSLTGSKGDSEVIFRSRRLVGLSDIYTLDSSNAISEIQSLKKTQLESYDATKYTVTRSNFSGADEEIRPFFILHPIDLKLNGETPCVLVDDDFFDPAGLYLTFLRSFNGIIAVPYLGSPRELLAPSSLEDFVKAAGYLVANKYTSPSRLILRRPGPGGLYSAAIINQRPDLFAAVIPEFVDFDMLRYHKYKGRPIWQAEFGTSDEKDKIDGLLKISPLHNIRLPTDDTVQYPAVLVTMAKDKWYPAQHSYKYISQLQYAIGLSARQTNPLMLRIGEDSHPQNPNRLNNIIEKEADVQAFLLRVLGLKLQ